MTQEPSYRWTPYAVALIAVAAVAALWYPLAPFLEKYLPYGTFLAAVGIAAILTEVVRRNLQKPKEAAPRLLEYEKPVRSQSDESARQLALLVEASGSLTSSLEPSAVLSSILALSQRLVAADAYAIWRFMADRGQWSIVASDGLSSEYAQSTLQVMGSTPQMPDETLVAEDVAELPILAERQEAYRAEGIRSILIAPLRIHGQVCGTLVLYYRTPRRFTEVETTTATALANLAAAAIGSADLYQRQRLAQEERLRLIQQLEEADRKKDEFLAMLAHELRNPLAAIRYAVDVSRLGASADGEVVDIIDHQSQQLAHLIDDLLDVSRITRGKIQLKLQAVDAAEIARRAVTAIRPLMEAHHHELLVDIAEGPMPLLGDPTRLEQVLINLLNNAAKYTPDGGRVRLELAREGGHIVFRVRDNGVGIAEPMLSKVFDLFSQVDKSLDRSQGGLGIGLTVVRSLVEMHGGRIEAHSDGPGRGSEFSVRLPGAERPAVQRQSRTREEDCDKSVRVLLVEDSDAAAAMLRVLLESKGHTVEVAADGPQAVDLAPRFRPDVVLLDIGLPGLDGYQVAARLRQHRVTREVTIIGLSGYGQEQDRQQSRDAGFDHHLLKPIEFDQLAPFLRAKRAR